MKSNAADIVEIGKLQNRINQDLRAVYARVSKIRKTRQSTIPGSLIGDDDFEYAEIPETHWRLRGAAAPPARRPVQHNEATANRLRAKFASLELIRPKTDWAHIFDNGGFKLTPGEFFISVRAKLRITDLAEPDSELRKLFDFLDSKNEGSILIEKLIEFIQSEKSEDLRMEEFGNM